MSASKLLGATLAKVNAVLASIETASELEFPYEDSRQALKVLASEFAEFKRDLLSFDGAAELTLVKGYCARVLEAIFQNLPLVGFLSRSASANGAPELQGPLRRLTTLAIGDEARLVISSEWDFSPFTLLYPQIGLSQYVLVGLPWSEATNALLAPLAGHELGHNLWRRHKVLNSVLPTLRAKLRDEVIARWSDFKSQTQLTDPKQLDDLIGQATLSIPFQSAIAQCEEVFCDLVGLLMFREGYLLAFEHLLAPGTSTPRSASYPSNQDRVAILVNTARTLDVSFPDGFEDSFQHQPTDNTNFLQSFADAATLAMTGDLVKCATDLTRSVALPADVEETERLVVRLRALLPATGASQLGFLINAGWKVYLEAFSESPSALGKIDAAQRLRVLNEVLLKSIEVFEIERRTT